MACRSILRNVFLTAITESCLPLPFMSNFTPIISAHMKASTLKPNCGCKAAINSRNEVAISAKSSQFARNCANIRSASSSSDDPPQEAVLKAISEISKTDGRVGQTTNVVIGGTVTDDSTNEWLTLDQKVNSYPTIRGFTAIGTGGDDFVHAMVVAVESVIHRSIPEGQVKQKIWQICISEHWSCSSCFQRTGSSSVQCYETRRQDEIFFVDVLHFKKKKLDTCLLILVVTFAYCFIFLANGS